MPTEKEITATNFMQNLSEVLEEINREKTIYIINSEGSQFVVGPVEVCRVALGFVGRERGWPVQIQVDYITDIKNVKPVKRRYPIICKNQTCLAIAINMSDYELIKKNLEVPKRQPKENLAETLPLSSSGSNRRTSGSWVEGQVVAGLYQVISVLGAGTFGTVYKVRHQLWQQDLAVKVPNKEMRNKRVAMERFRKEAQTWTELGLHPNIVTCYYVRELSKIPRIFLEYVGGGNFRDKIKDLTLEQSLDFAIQICRGVGYSHEHGLVHRDLKPENCLLTENGVLKVTDFGLVKIQETVIDEGKNAGKTGDAGTPEYMAPEQWGNASNATFKADIWALGVMLYEMCVGHKLFVWEDEEPKASFHARLITTNWAHDELPKKLPYKLVKLIEQCLKIDPAERPESVAAIEAELTAIYEKIAKKPYARKKIGAVALLATSLNNKGVSLIDLKETKEALAEFSKALEVDPSHPEAVYNQALLLWKNGEITDLDAVDRVKAVSVNLPSVWKPHYLLGLIHVARQDAEAAVSALLEAEKIEPEEPEIDVALEKISTEKLDWPKCARILEGSNDSVKAVTFSSDNKFAASGNGGGSVNVWDLKTGRLKRTFQSNCVSSVAFSPDCKSLLVGSESKTFAQKWDIETGECTRSYQNTTVAGEIQFVSFSPDGNYALTGSNENVYLWDLTSGKNLKKLKGHKELVSWAAFSSDGKFAVTGSWDNTARLWDLETGECKFVLEGHVNGINSVAVASDAGLILTGSLDHTARVWDLASGKCVRILKGHSLSVDGVAFSADGEFALTAGRDQTVRLWNLKTGECTRSLLGHKAGVACVAFSVDRRFALTGGADQTVRLWTLGTGECSELLFALGKIRSLEEEVKLQSDYAALVEEIEEQIWKENWQKADDLLSKARALPGYERHPTVMALWAKIGQKSLRTNCKAAWCVKNINVKGELSTVISVAFSADARFAVTASEDRPGACLWNLETGNCIPLQEHSANVCSVAISPNGAYALTGSVDQTARLWDAKSGKCLQVLSGQLGEVRFVAFSSDGKKALTAGTDCTAKLWELRTGECKAVLSGHKGHIHAVVFSPDGRHVLTGSSDKTARLWGAKSGKCLAILEGHTGEVDALAFSSDGKSALTGSDDNTARFWDLTSKECKQILQGHTHLIRSVALSPDDKYALTGSIDKTARLWDLTTGSCLHVLCGHNASVASVAFSPDGQFALTGSWDSTARIWSLKTGKSIIELTGHAGSVALVMFSPDSRYAVTASYDKTIRVWECDWDYKLPPETDWNAGAEPYLQTFLSLHTPYLGEGFCPNGGPAWTEADFKQLRVDLSFRGFGWLTKEGVRRKLRELAEAQIGKPQAPQ